MKIEELKEDKNLIDIKVDLDENDLKKLANTAYLYQLSDLPPVYEKNITKDFIDNFYGPNALLIKFNNPFVYRIIDFIKDNTDYDYFIEPIRPTNEPAEFNVEEPLEFKAVLKPEVEILNYKEDLSYPSFKEDNEEIETRLTEKLEELVKQNVRLEPTEKPYEEGNSVSADLLITYQGQVISQEENEILDAEKLADLFNNELLIGKNIGDEVINDKSAIKSRIKINQIYNPDFPELDDDFAADISEFDTLDEFKDSLRKDIIEDLKSEYNQDKKKVALEKFIKGSSLTDNNNEELKDFKNDNHFSEIIKNLNLENMVIQKSFDNKSTLENHFDYLLLNEFFNKVLENEGIDLTETIEKEVNNYKEGKPFGDDIPNEIKNLVNNPYINDQIRNSNLIEDMLRYGLTYQKATEILVDNVKEED